MCIPFEDRRPRAHEHESQHPDNDPDRHAREQCGKYLLRRDEDRSVSVREFLHATSIIMST